MKRTAVHPYAAIPVNCLRHLYWSRDVHKYMTRDFGIAAHKMKYRVLCYACVFDKFPCKMTTLHAISVIALFCRGEKAVDDAEEGLH